METRQEVLSLLLKRYPGEHLSNGGRANPRNEFERYVVEYGVEPTPRSELPLREDYVRPGSSDLDGVTIEWFRSARDFFGMAVDPDSADVIRNDEENFLDPAGLLWMLTGPEHVVLDRR